MFRTSGLNAEIIDHLIDKPVVFALGAGPSSFMPRTSRMNRAEAALEATTASRTPFWTLPL